MVQASKSQFIFLSVILFGVFILAFFIVKPFLYSIILAIALAVACKPIHQKITTLTGQRPSIAAGLTTLIIILFIFIPFMFFGIQIVKEAKMLYLSLLQNGGSDGITILFNDLIGKLQNIIPVSGIESSLPTNIDEYLKQGLNWMIQNIGSLFSNTAIEP